MSSTGQFNQGASTGSSTEEAEPLMPITEVIGLTAPPKPEEPVQEEEEPPKVDLSPYEAWKAAPSQDTLASAVNSLKPTISSVLASMGGSGSPRLSARARVVAAKAIQTYDPSHGASLPTWVSQQLRQLSRDIRKSNSVLHVPDGVKLDAYALYRAERAFEDEHGYEPTLEELADAAKMSPKRIADVRRKMRAEGQETNSDENNQTVMSGEEDDFSQEALDYVYPMLDRKDKIILEYTTGYNGRPPRDTAWLKQKLGLTDVQLHRRKMRVSTLVKEAIEGLEDIQQ